MFEHDDRELRRELEHHIELLTHEYVRQGTSHSEARRRAPIAFGELERIEERLRGWASIEHRVPRVASRLSGHD